MTAVIWIDWYSYHISRFRALVEHESLQRNVTGIELVGGCGVHAGLHFRDGERAGLPILSLFPEADWQKTKQTTMARALWRELQRLNPSSVLVPGWYTLPALTAAVWARLHGKRSIVMSETTEADYSRAWWKEAVKRLLIGLLFDYGIAGGKPHVRYLARLGFAPSRIARHYDVVDNEFYREHAESARQSPEMWRASGLPENYFLYVGRLAPEKNVDGLLRAYARYRRAGGTWSLVLVGDGPERASLERLCAGLEIANDVQFAGLKSARETTTYFAFAGCFVLPSSREPWGLVVNEAMASGLPVIVSGKCGCAEDLVAHGVNGYLFDPASDEELSGHLLAMSEAPFHSRMRMGRKSLEIIDGYSPRHWAEEVARLVNA
jgi:1,2-diacylglycerol 3-alpha-glucosyltransferase